MEEGRGLKSRPALIRDLIIISALELSSIDFFGGDHSYIMYRISSYKTRRYYFFVGSSTAGIIKIIRVRLVRALLEMRVLFEGGLYMRKYGKHL